MNYFMNDKYEELIYILVKISRNIIIIYINNNN